jgi:hypothetical protein
MLMGWPQAAARPIDTQGKRKNPAQSCRIDPGKRLPRTFPPKRTVHDYLSYWSEQQAFRKPLARYIRHLVQKGRLELEQCFVDATFSPARAAAWAWR